MSARDAGENGARATRELNGLYRERTRLMTMYWPHKAAGNQDRAVDLEHRLAVNHSNILAKQAEIIGYQQEYTDAVSAESSDASIQEAIDGLTAAIEAHTESIKRNNEVLRQQRDLWHANAPTVGKQTDLARAALTDRAFTEIYRKPPSWWQRLKNRIHRSASRGMKARG